MTAEISPIVVAIVGGSGSGKSWLADRLQRSLGGEATQVSLDNFYRDRSHLSGGTRVRVNFDHPRAIDWECVTKFLKQARRGIATNIPEYDFNTHCRIEPLAWQPKPVVLFEGLWLLARRDLRPYFDL